MVVIIKTGHSIQRILNYNENKIKEGQAIIISASNYPMDLNQLSFKNKLNRLINQASLNEDVSRNSVHISLNFGPAENLSKDSLSEIAETYMNRIGFGEQPFLVYQHFDAGHPHVHIVSIKVRSDGSRIDTHNIGRNQSEKARKEIENLFGLKKAEDSKNNLSYELKPVSVQKVQYGKTASKRAISVILDRIIDQYKFCSIAELNAVLRQYNVIADQGSEASRIYKNNGLVYRILDSQGNKTGVPIKASDFYNKPTLKRLQERFLINEISKQPHKARIKNAIDLIFLGEHPSLQQMITILEKEGISTILRQNDEGILYGLTYVDHKIKVVYNGSELGKNYSAKGILNRVKLLKENQSLNEISENITKSGLQPGIHQTDGNTTPDKLNSHLLDTLLQPEYINNYIPNQLTPKRKKGRKGRSKKL